MNPLFFCVSVFDRTTDGDDFAAGQRRRVQPRQPIRETVGNSGRDSIRRPEILRLEVPEQEVASAADPARVCDGSDGAQAGAGVSASKLFFASALRFTRRTDKLGCTIGSNNLVNFTLSSQ